MTFFVPGTPVPKGSIRAFMPKGYKYPILTSVTGKPLKVWSKAIKYIAGQYLMQAREFPVEVSLDFVMRRPKKPKHEKHIVRPDIDKLCRAALDPLTGILIKDDSYIVKLTATKRYAYEGENSTGCWFTIDYL